MGRQRSLVRLLVMSFALLSSASASTAAAQHGSSTSSAIDATAIEWARVRYAVVVGQMRNSSGYTEEDLSDRLLSAVKRHLRKYRRVAVLTPDDLTPQVIQKLEGMKLPTFRLEGTVARVQRGKLGGQTSVRAEISLMLMDEAGRNMRTIMKGAATGVEPPMGSLEYQERKLARQAVSGAAASALSDAYTAIRGAASAGDARMAMVSQLRRATR